MKEKIAGLSVFVNLILAVGKIIVGFLAKSTSVIAEGIHSGMDVISSGISLVGIRISKKPVDKKHPYGHYKFEVLSGLVITILLFATGIWIIYEAYKGFLNPEIVSISYLALGIMLLSVILNEITARLKIHYGKKENSLSLLSDGVHDRVDVYSSIAVLIGLLIMPYWVYIDSILALLIGLYILKESLSLGKEATDSLLDVSAGEEIEDKIKKIAEQNNIEISDIKTQKKGAIVTANIEIQLPSKINVEEATKISKNLKENLIKNIEPLEYVAIQIKSHDFTDSYYQPKDIVSKITNRGFGWQRKGKFKDKIKEAEGKGPEGYCVCKKCGYRIKHQRGTPCSTIKCPKCKVNLTRE
ncbi:cation diffusion facilitator family transporter [Candidatus Pacearchaeota archaeon]|nr:cation diffusion facilitator family transporter [Candidatus Pacearchaeota archaeon]MBD3282745.1 cation diffusion facilitator family transporter [Candidatus Pacearchaeota archaeon]